MKVNTIETTEMLKAILSSIDEGIHVVDAAGTTIFYNEVASELDGLSIDDVQFNHLLDAFPSLNGETSTLLKVIQTGKPILNKHQSYKNRKGQQIDTVNSTLPIFLNGDLIGAVEVAKDFSRIRELSEKLMDLQAKVSPAKKHTDADHQASFTFDDLLTNDPDMSSLIKMGKKVAMTSSSVLIYGETGTGKEMFIQAIHNASIRKEAPFIAQNCAAIPSALLEGILFGTSKGSFTGAVDRPGFFELADGGTLFLDELNSMPLDLQAKLLRVIQEGVVQRVGASKGKRINVRVMGALNEPPELCVQKETLRKDLYYRLNVIYLELPPLRKRKKDIVLLADYFIRIFSKEFHKSAIRADQEVISQLESYYWPGNVRELKHAIEFAMNMTEREKEIQLGHLPPHIRNAEKSANIIHEKRIPPLREALNELEKELIERALSQSEGNILKAAKMLQIPRQTLQYKLKLLNH